MEQNNQNQAKGNGKDFILGTVIGALIGAAAALFMAPKSGRELREDFNENSGVLKERAGEWKEQAVSTTSELSKNVSQKSQELGSKVKTKVQGESTEEKEAEQAAQEVAEAIEEAARELEQEQLNEETKG
ncbi:YtxH domain-containing protein [Salimicrobium sp. PL1-032A]|uniref:YtxH domain-containing protein n=1 Tax=Salimicrobium sp. PL1-032A TaxID=3095364 RepID=UPI003260EB31